MATDDIFLIGAIVIIFFITCRKKAKQLGKMWDKPLSATVVIQDKELHCAHCGHDKFKKREGLLTTTWATFFRLAFWNQSAPCYVCTHCGNVHWFLSPEEKAEIQHDFND